MALAELPDVQQLSPEVICLLGQNRGPFTLQGTNTYLLGASRARVLIDTGEGNDAYAALLARELAARACFIAAVVITHSHYDHEGGLPSVIAASLEARARLVAEGDATAVAWAAKPIDVYRRVLGEAATAATAPTAASPLAATGPPTWRLVPVSDGDEVAVADVVLRVMATPGHTPDSISLVHAASDAVFVGDCVLGAGSCSFSHLGSYLSSLRRLRDVNPGALCCGHGPCVGVLARALGCSATAASGAPPAVHGSHADVVVAASATSGAASSTSIPPPVKPGTGKVEEYLRHRQHREDQVMGALRGRATAAAASGSGSDSGDASMSPPELVAALYPPDVLATRPLVEAAAAVIALHCEKLVEEGVLAMESPPPPPPPTGDGAAADDAAPATIRGVAAALYHGRYRLLVPVASA